MPCQVGKHAHGQDQEKVHLNCALHVHPTMTSLLAARSGKIIVLDKVGGRQVGGHLLLLLLLLLQS